MRDRGIEDQRGFLHRHAGLLSRQGRTEPTHHWAEDGREAGSKGPCLAVESAVGYFGYYSGFQVHVLDINALTDPLLARLPSIDPVGWRIGHFVRKIPAGYKETLLSRKNRIRDSKLAAYYDKLSFVTRGDLFDLKRIAEIWALNTGRYSDLNGFDYYRNQNLALYLARNGSTEEAFGIFDTVLSRQPSRAEGWYVLGKLHQREGNLSEASSAFQKAIRLDPGQRAYRAQLLTVGRAYWDQGLRKKALALRDRALASH